MKIGKLSELSDCSIQAIRYYEKEGLIAAPQRSDGNFRLYNNSALSRLKFIRRCRALDITLAEIRQLLNLQQNPSQSCNKVNNMIDRHITEVRDKAEELKTLEHELQSLRIKCHDGTVIDECGIMENLSQQNKTS